MAYPRDPAPRGAKRPPLATITSQAQEDLPTLTGTRQTGQLVAAKPNRSRQLRSFLGSNQVRTCLIFLPPALLLFTLFVTWPVVEADNFGIKRMRVGFGSAIGVTLFVICVVFMRPREGR